ncbi:hypothetical protein CAPTEDRAFT_210851 [Capitella teleta]|uniref:BTB domain-containing protein n=1 Tax=Capitella teleta TaxID=283909 RepID=R7U1M6_CAPTE|nr:hypothetical protein CAPTEDRAFT_210851 [Capitella teleta]|eukprot:ELT99864.1 hypothetical protein CAPTEDRAFT_210851 [Capitella teleta]
MADRFSDTSINIFERFQSLREDKVLTDLVLVIGDQRIDCHRVILASFSPYIRRQLMEDDSSELVIDDINFESLEVLVELIYAGELFSVDADNANEILNAIQLLEVSALATADFIAAMMDIEDSLSILRMAESSKYDVVLKEAAMLKLCIVFLDVTVRYELDESNVEEFLKNMTESEIINLISREDLSVSNEIDVFRAVLKWTNADSNRKQYFMNIVEHVRFNLMEKSDLDIVKEEELMQNAKGLRMIEEAEFKPRKVPEADIGLEEDSIASVEIMKFQFLERLNEIREEQQLVDLVLFAGNQQINCHKAIMAAASPYFEKVLTSDTKQTEEGEVRLTGHTGDTIHLIVDAIYGKQLQLGDDNVEEVLVASHQFELTECEDECIDFICSHVTCNNCVDFYLLAKTHDLDRLRCNVTDYLTKSKDKIENVHLLKAEDWIDILSAWDTNVTPDLLSTILEWAKTDARHMDSLASVIQSAYLDPHPDYLPLIESNKELLSKAGAYDELRGMIEED